MLWCSGRDTLHYQQYKPPKVAIWIYSVSSVLNAMEKCMFVNQLMAEGMMEMVEESEVQSRATQQLVNVFRDSVAKQ